MRVKRAVAPYSGAAHAGMRRGGVHWLLVFSLLLAAAFIEVWEATVSSQLSLEINGLEVKVRNTQAQTSLLDARIAETSSRVRLVAYAKALQMRPADLSQVVVIPRDLLAADARAGVPEDAIAAATQRAAELFVPSARARGRREATE